jgi:MFS family permease
VALIAGIVFVPYELRHRQPMIDLRFFRRAPFSGAILIAVLSSAGFNSLLFLASLFLQQVRDRSPISAGLYLLPMGVMTAVFAPLSGSLIARTGPRRPLLLSGVLLSGGAALMTLAVTRDSPLLILASVVLTGAGFGFVNAPVTFIAASEMPAEQAGIAAATSSTGRLIGGALGIAVIGSVLAERTSGPIAHGFGSASAPCWWIIAGCGAAVLVVSAVATARRPAFRRGRPAVELASTGTP